MNEIEMVAAKREQVVTAAMELERKILELIKQEEPLFYASTVAITAVKLLKMKFN